MTDETLIENLTPEMVVAITNAQLEHTRELITLSLPPNRLSDDGADYLMGALDLSRALLEMDVDTQAFANFLNSDNMQDYASDAICQAIYDLKPPFLEE